MRVSTRAGFTLLELLVGLAILSVMAGLGMTFARPANDLRAATAVKTMLLWARAEAVWHGVPVAVTELPLASGFVVRSLPSGSGDCDDGEILGRLLLADHPGVRLAAGFGVRGGIVWLASGSGRSCAGGGVISADLRLASLTGTSHVIVSSLGRVRVERGP